MVESLRERIITARDSVRSAEVRLTEIIATEGAKTRADKVEASDALRAALSKLRAARAKLEHLQGGISHEHLEIARDTVQETVRQLDLAIGALQSSPRSRKVWVSSGIDEGLAELREARERVAKLEATLGSTA